MKIAPRVQRRGHGTALPPEQLALAWQSASLLLDYPDERLPERLDLAQRAGPTLPAAVGTALGRTVEALTGPSLRELQAEYVETFDNRRRHNLFLTYFAHGDTRKRGMALLRFKEVYRAAGLELVDDAAFGDELPDHLCVVLEFGACVDADAGRRLLLDHRAGLELLRVGLRDVGSRWAGAVEAVTLTLPALEGDDEVAIQRLAAQGPPAEEVGLTPYETPGFDPGPATPGAGGAGLAGAGGVTALPMPTFPGGR